jgi:hypothetical protein
MVACQPHVPTARGGLFGFEPSVMSVCVVCFVDFSARLLAACTVVGRRAGHVGATSLPQESLPDHFPTLSTPCTTGRYFAPATRTHGQLRAKILWLRGEACTAVHVARPRWCVVAHPHTSGVMYRQASAVKWCSNLNAACEGMWALLRRPHLKKRAPPEVQAMTGVHSL